MSREVLIGRGLDLKSSEKHNAQMVRCSVLKVLEIFYKNKIGGVDGGEDPPVPIPNTEVKLTSVDNTWLATAREDRATPPYFVIILHSSVGRAHDC